MNPIQFDANVLNDFTVSSKKEFLETNDIGTYCSSTLSGCNTRKYHGVLVARQPQIDHHSYVLVNALHETFVDGQATELGVHQYPMTLQPKGYENLLSFELKKIPTFEYQIGKSVLKKEILVVQGANQVLIRYTLKKGKAASLELAPFSSFRRIHKLRQAFNEAVEVLSQTNGISYNLDAEYDSVYIQTSSKSLFQENSDWHRNAEYLVELERGYDFREDLFCPGSLEIELEKGASVVVSISTKKAKVKDLEALFESELKTKKNLKSLDDHLNRSAQQFISTTKKGVEICAGYHWFGRWGRDTFLSLPGLTLSRKQPQVCFDALKTMLKDLKGGLLTNIGVGAAARYNSADASLWFFWALQEYVDTTNSSKTAWKDFGKEIKHILSHYKKGTLYNIHMAPSGLLYGGQEDVALTWMDAMVDGYPVTPRAGYTVELNALWYHAICVALEYAKKGKDEAFVKEWSGLPEKIKPAFKAMFWDDQKGYLADACEENKKDWSFRPNQVFATSLKYSVCDKEMSQSILKQVEEKLLTPKGLRTLAQDDVKYIPFYEGDQKTRDRSYHQGIVWPWLLGHFAGGYVKVFEDSAVNLLTQIYQGFEQDLFEYGIGSVAEIYDAEQPYEPKGTISQAWSVSELLRIKQLIEQLKGKKK